MNLKLNAFDIILYFEHVINEYIEHAKNELNSLNEQDPNYDKYELLSRSKIYIDPDEDINLTIPQEHTEPSIIQPAIIIEIDSKNITTNSVTGKPIYGEHSYTISVVVPKEGRKFIQYKRESITLAEIIENIFGEQTDKRINIGNTTYSDFMFGSIEASGAVIPVNTNINNFDYSINS